MLMNKKKRKNLVNSVIVISTLVIFSIIGIVLQLEDVSITGAVGAAGSCTAPLPSLVSWWPGDGNAQDFKGDNDGGTFTGNYATGRFNDAFNFDGVNDVFRLARTDESSGTLNPSTAISVEAWINPHSNKIAGIAGKWANHDDDDKKYPWLLWQRDEPPAGYQGRVSWVVNNGRDNTYETDGGYLYANLPIIDDNRWYHVVGTYDSTAQEIKLYLNGQLIDSAKQITPIKNNPNADFLIGAYSNDATNYNYFEGLIDEVAVYDTALTLSQIEANYAGGVGGAVRAR